MDRVKEIGKSNHEAVLDFFRARKAEGKLLATIVGGEPYVNPQLLKKVVEIMPANWVVTSGTTPLMHLPKTTHFVSIDGKDSATHDEVRGMSGLYDRILQNLSCVRNEGSFPVFIHSVLNRLNFRQIGEMVEIWEDNGLADGIVFSTMTPILNGSDEKFRLTRKDRMWIVEELLVQQKLKPDFLFMTPKMIQCLHPDFTKNQTPKTCGTARLVASYDASGVGIPQCILSDKADCSECGCIITAIFESVLRFPPELAAVRILGKMYTP
ncbi:MAG: hypothetical protein WC657_02045 [Candidatus Paceibacterota bacterium]|jgi:MoaA/NifB/PqqE/SkfB family radical SAM enzyme